MNEKDNLTIFARGSPSVKWCTYVQYLTIFSWGGGLLFLAYIMRTLKLFHIGIQVF